jgi:hypothetical protein
MMARGLVMRPSRWSSPPATRLSVKTQGRDRKTSNVVAAPNAHCIILLLSFANHGGMATCHLTNVAIVAMLHVLFGNWCTLLSIPLACEDTTSETCPTVGEYCDSCLVLKEQLRRSRDWPVTPSSPNCIEMVLKKGHAYGGGGCAYRYLWPCLSIDCRDMGRRRDACECDLTQFTSPHMYGSNDDAR